MSVTLRWTLDSMNLVTGRVNEHQGLIFLDFSPSYGCVDKSLLEEFGLWGGASTYKYWAIYKVSLTA